MLYVITGVSGSGKSEYAENRAVQLSGGKNLYYVATMEPYGEEGVARIERHHKLRAGKGFTTIECYRDIVDVVNLIGAERCKEATILLECMSNLLANEMFPLGTRQTRTQEQAALTEESILPRRDALTEQYIVDQLLSGISCISRQCRHLIIVTNEVFSDGIDYDEQTKVYIKYIGSINQKLVEMADEAVEVVYSVPMMIKN